MKKTDNGEGPFYIFNNLSQQAELLHFVSSGTKNIGFTEGENPDDVVKNRRVLAQSVGFCPEKLITAHQVHSVNIRIVGGEEAGRGAVDKESRLPDTDALVTNEEKVCLLVMSADCVPVLLYEPEARVIAAVHAGWRGTAGNIAAATALLMQEKFACRPERILAAIGPSIGPCCFEVGEEVAEVFRLKFPAMDKIVAAGNRPGKYRVDLWEANRRQLLEAGLVSHNIEISGICTVCGPEKFFSYRRDGRETGRFGAGIMLRETGQDKTKNK